MADSAEADVSIEERVDAELGVEALFAAAGRWLSMDSEGRCGRCSVGAVDGRS